MDDERIDFSALDPKCNPEHFERMVRAIMAGARSPTPAPHPLSLQLIRWGAATVAIAAALAAVAWLPTLTRGRYGVDAGVTAATDPVELVSAWADKGAVPSDIDLPQALGGEHVIR
jgi:hypothetical protein